MRIIKEDLTGCINRMAQEHRRPDASIKTNQRNKAFTKNSRRRRSTEATFGSTRSRNSAIVYEKDTKAEEEAKGWTRPSSGNHGRRKLESHVQ